MERYKGLFITLEGGDGSGKSTIALRLKEILSLKYDILHTREPGGSKIAEEIRAVILDPENTLMDPKTEALLYAASRRQHLTEKVIPALNDGKIVLCERYVDSSLAYQGYARGLGIDYVKKINEMAIDGYYPDLTLYLKIDPEIGLSRLKSRSGKDRLDQESIAFHYAVFKCYEKLIQEDEKRFKIIDAAKDIDAVVESCLEALRERLDV